MNSTKLTKKIKLNLTLRMKKKVMMDLELLTSRKPCKITSRAMPPPKETPERRRTTKEVSKKMISLVSLMTILGQTKMKFTTRREDTKTKKDKQQGKKKKKQQSESEDEAEPTAEEQKVAEPEVIEPEIEEEAPEFPLNVVYCAKCKLPPEYCSFG